MSAQYLDAGGMIPTSLVNRKLPEALGVVQEAIDEFRQDDKIDEADRTELAMLVLLTTSTATEKGLKSRNALREVTSAFLEMNGVVTGAENIAVRLKRSKKGVTKLDLAIELDLGAHVSKAAKLEFIKCRLNEAGEVAIYFHRLVPLEGLIEEVRFLRR